MTVSSKVEENGEKYYCLKCDYLTANKKKLEKHLVKTHWSRVDKGLKSEPGGTFACVRCGVSKSSQIEAVSHLLSCCSSCSLGHKVTTTLIKCKKFIRVVLTCNTCKEDVRKWIRCKLCSYIGNEDYSLAQHLRMKEHSTELIKCPACCFTSNSKIGVARHMHELGHGDTWKWCSELLKEMGHSMIRINALSQCELCKETFTDPPSLVQHMRDKVHGARTIKCSFCSYKTSDSIASHMHSKKHDHLPPPTSLPID